MKKKFFISCPDSNWIEYWTIDSQEKVKLIQKINVSGIVQPLLYNSKKKILYAGIRPNHAIKIYKFCSITQKFHPYDEYSMFNTPNHLYFNSLYNILICSSFHGNGFAIYKLKKSGKIEKIIKIEKNIFGCHSSILNYKNDLLFSTSLKKDTIFQYFIKNQKHNFLKKHQKEKFVLKEKTGPRHIIAHPYKNFIYCINENNGTINVFKISNQTNKIKLIQSISLFQKKNNFCPWSAEISIHPNGLFLYACDRNSNSITLFNIHPTLYILKFIQLYPVDIQPRSFALDSIGKYLISVGQKSNTFSMYKINSNNGNLHFLKKKTIGLGPLWVTIE